MSDLYESDILVWSERQAELLRRHAAGERVNEGELDWPNIIEEIKVLGRSDRRELRNRVRAILLHLIKLEASPANEPRAKWHATVLEQRAGLDDLLRDSPSLRPTIAATIGDEIVKARALAASSLADHHEQPRVDLGAINFTDEQVVGPWLPDRLG